MGDVLPLTPRYSGRVWQINEDEDAALQYLPWGDQVLYLRGLRKHMDFTTGVVGVRRRISYQQLSELLEVQRARGSTLPSERVGKEQLRAILRRLEVAGLIVRVGTDRVAAPLVFRLPLAHTVLNRFDEEPHRNHTEGTTRQNIEKSKACDAGTPQEQHSMNHTPQYINNNSSKDECTKTGVSVLGQCPHAEILELWAKHCSSRQQPKPTLWVGSAAARNLASRWAQAAKIKHSSGARTLYHDRESGLEWWGKFFEYVAQRNAFLMSDEARTWFTLRWPSKKENFLKVLDKAFEG